MILASATLAAVLFEGGETTQVSIQLTNDGAGLLTPEGDSLWDVFVATHGDQPRQVTLLVTGAFSQDDQVHFDHWSRRSSTTYQVVRLPPDEQVGSNAA